VLTPLPLLLQQPQQPPPAVFPMDADIVLVDVVAVDGSGEPVLDLALEDFEVKDSGHRRPIILFRAPEPSGRAVVFVIEDALARGWHVERARDLVERAISRAKPGDRILVIAQASHVATSAVLPEGAAGLRKALGRVRPHSEIGDAATSPDELRALGQRRVDAVLKALESLRGHPGPRALVVLGPAFPYRADSPVGVDAHQRVLRASQVVAAPVFFLKWGEDQAAWAGLDLRPQPATGEAALGGTSPMAPLELPEERELGELAFDAVASDSGGFATRTPQSWAWSVDRVLARARAAYVLGIPSAPDARDGRYHPLDVSVARAGVRLYTRKGYFAPGARR
jgi:VWFA-related protein